jgi:hypothetical protein
MNNDDKCKKTKYCSKVAAELDIAKIKRISTQEKIPQRAYRCNKCGCWHLTSKPASFYWHGKLIEIKTN